MNRIPALMEGCGSLGTVLVVGGGRTGGIKFSPTETNTDIGVLTEATPVVTNY